MKDGHIKRSELQDPLGKKYYPFHPGRDRSRTPMQWDSTNHAAFSEAKPWLPVNQDYPLRNVASQENDPSSLLTWYKRLILMRKSHEALHSGSIDFLPMENKNILCYTRRANDEKILVLLNFSTRNEVTTLPATGKILLSTHRKIGDNCHGSINLASFETLILGINP